jgi:membrane associated rhomboid family serine protease
MLEDRPYMRRPSFAPRWSITLLLVIANAAAFILQNLLATAAPQIILNSGLSVNGLSHGYVWQLITFQFMHAGWLHLLLNCFAIYMFGREVEEALGRKGFLTLYFSSGILGGLLQLGYSKLLAWLTNQPAFLMTHVVGASAGACGLIAAFAMLYPERPLMLLLFFIIPVNMRAKFLLLFEGIITLVGLASVRSNIAHAAHMGGMLTGIIFVRYAIHWQWPAFHRAKRRPLQRLVKVPSEKPTRWGRTRNADAEDLPADEFLSREVDPILDKISAQGIQSLTERERRILEAAREKMAKR